MPGKSYWSAAGAHAGQTQLVAKICAPIRGAREPRAVVHFAQLECRGKIAFTLTRRLWADAQRFEHRRASANTIEVTSRARKKSNG